MLGRFWVRNGVQKRVICRLNRETCCILYRRGNYFFFIPKAGELKKSRDPPGFLGTFFVFLRFCENWCFLGRLRSLGLSVWTSENSCFWKSLFWEVKKCKKTLFCTFFFTCLPRAPAFDFFFWTKKTKSESCVWKAGILFWAKNAYAFGLSQECLSKGAR